MHSNLHSIALSCRVVYSVNSHCICDTWLSAWLAWVGSTNALCERAMAWGTGTVLRFGSSFCHRKSWSHWGLHAVYEWEKNGKNDGKNRSSSRPAVEGAEGATRVQKVTQMCGKSGKRLQKKQPNQTESIQSGSAPCGSMWLFIEGRWFVDISRLFALRRLGHIETTLAAVVTPCELISWRPKQMT